MNIPLPVHLDKSAFIDWMQRHEGRYELVGGRVVMMPGVSRGHARIVTNLVLLNTSQLDSQKWDVVAEFGLDAGPETLRYPDILVDRAGGNPRDFTATAPALLVEVLSPSSEGIDLDDKALEYLQLPDLFAYVVFSQTEPRAWIWIRQANGMPSTPEIVRGLDKVIRIAALDLDLPLREVYARIEVQ
jgi:Uma2 family endonuclease